MQTQIETGKTIKEIEVDWHQHLFWLRFLLIVFNVFLIGAVVALILLINRWYIWVIDVAIIALCFYKSIMTMHNASKTHSYELCENAIKLNSIWYEAVIELSSIYKVTYKQTLSDKIFKANTHALILYIKDNGYYKIKLKYIKEDINELVNDIMEKALLARAKNKST